MDSSAHELVVKTRKLIGLQLLIAVLLAVGFFWGKGTWEALSAGYGGLISVISALLLSRGVIRASSNAQTGSKSSEVILYVGAAVRFVLVLVLFGFGLAGLKLAAVPTVAGFIATQLAFVVSMNRDRTPSI